MTKYWFPAKRYGWGWGPPTSTEGRIVLVIYFAAIGLMAYWFLRSNDVAHFVTGTCVATVALMVVCWITGEPPRWRGRR